MMQQIGNAVPPLLARQVALALRASLATVSQRSKTVDLRQVTHEVSATVLHELREYLLAWGERTKKPVGTSQLLEAIVANASPDDLVATLGGEGEQRVPLTCYLPSSVIEEIQQIGEAMVGHGAGVCDPQDVIDRFFRHFNSRSHYDRTHLMWESHRQRRKVA